MEWKAFQGANGWYVAFENDEGTHYQPSSASQTRAEAQREASAINASGGRGDNDEYDEYDDEDQDVEFDSEVV